MSLPRHASAEDWRMVVEATAESLLEERPDFDNIDIHTAAAFVEESSWILQPAYHVACLVYGNQNASEQYDVDNFDSLAVRARYALAEAVYERAGDLHEAF